MKTGLITKDCKFIEIPYYEIGEFAENICGQYINESETNRYFFEEFAKNYTTFKPYLDFLLFHLGYKMINPLLHKDCTWEVNNNILQLKTSNGSLFNYLPVDDVSLQIGEVVPSEISDCIIDFNGKCYKTRRKEEIHHEDIYELVINQYLIYDKELYEYYSNYINSDYAVGCFGREILGFRQVVIYPDNSGFIIYCSDFENQNLEDICDEITMFYPNVERDSALVHTEESLRIANQCIERMRKINEDRRLRF